MHGPCDFILHEHVVFDLFSVLIGTAWRIVVFLQFEHFRVFARESCCLL